MQSNLFPINPSPEPPQKALNRLREKVDLGFLIKAKIYVLKDPITMQVRYVGNTIRALSDRLSRHVQDASKGRDNPDKNEWILNLRAHGLRPIIEAVDEVPVCDAITCEGRWIKAYKMEHPDLFNIINAGKDLTPKNKELRENYSKLIKSEKRNEKSWFKAGHVPSLESEERRIKSLRLAYKEGRKRSLKGVPILVNRKPVEQFDLNGNFIAEHDALKLAAQATGIYIGLIQKNLVGTYKQTHGFVFKYKNPICQAE